MPEQPPPLTPRRMPPSSSRDAFLGENDADALDGAGSDLDALCSRRLEPAVLFAMPPDPKSIPMVTIYPLLPLDDRGYRTMRSGPVQNLKRK